jgi:3-oxoacyl-[acyl-carrier-protein] synthase III
MLTSTNNQKHMASLLGGVFNTDSNANHLCRGDGNSNELMMETDSEELLKFGINLGKSTFNDFLHEFQITQKNISLALMHQVGSAHESLSLEAFQLKDTPTFKTYPTLGNTGSSALPITLMLAQEENKIKSKDFVALLGIGSGLVSAMLGVKWN